MVSYANQIAMYSDVLATSPGQDDLVNVMHKSCKGQLYSPTPDKMSLKVMGLNPSLEHCILNLRYAEYGYA